MQKYFTYRTLLFLLGTTLTQLSYGSQFEEAPQNSLFFQYEQMKQMMDLAREASLKNGSRPRSLNPYHIISFPYEESALMCAKRALRERRKALAQRQNQQQK